VFVISSICPFVFHPPSASCALQQQQQQQQQQQLQQHVIVVLMMFPKSSILDCRYPSGLLEFEDHTAMWCDESWQRGSLNVC